MTREQFEKVGNFLTSEEFEAKADSCETVDGILSLMRENDIDISLEDLKYFLANATGSTSGDEELSDDELENVAGGSLITWIKNKIAEVKRDWNKIKNGFENLFSGQYVVDVAEGKRDPW